MKPRGATPRQGANLKTTSNMTKFRQFCLELNLGLYHEFKLRVMNEVKGMEGCPITAQTFRNWRDGRCEPADDKRDQLNKIAIDVTGRPIYA